jgi:uncharacterized protein
MRTGTADLPLHGGRAPRWLFERMTLLAREMSLAILEEEGTAGLMRRLADPVWFQAFGCVLGFDWHSSGLTTTACGALKEGLRQLSSETGLYVAGGKGKTSRKTPQEIEAACWQLGREPEPLVRASRLSAKVDSAAVQDGFQIYHHSFFFASDGSWAVVQQGMNESSGMARRYHWLPPERFDCDPHAAIAGERGQSVLNLVASEGEGNRQIAVALASESPTRVLGELKQMRSVEMPRHHQVRLSDLHPDRIARALLSTYEQQPQDYTALLAVPGLGAKGLRALALVAELTYGEPASVRDPVSYSFAHGGKDGTPYPVDRSTYDGTIESLRRAVSDARAGYSEKSAALKRLAGVELQLRATPNPGRLESASIAG